MSGNYAIPAAYPLSPHVSLPAIVPAPRDECAAVVLLAGVLRPTEWHDAIARPLLDLPVDQEQTLLDLWHGQAAALARSHAPSGMPLRVRLDHATAVPSRPRRRRDLVRVAVDRDAQAWRGSGGVLCDVTAEYADDARVVAVHAAQVPLRSLRAVVAELYDANADVALTAPERGACGGVMLLRCAALRELPDIGFCDFNEQALPIIARRFVTRAVARPTPVGMPVRTRAGYVQALRLYHRTRQGIAAGGHMAEDWKPAFGIIEHGASVHPTAQVLDSVVLRGARVERGAVLVRSVVCPGAVVRRDRVLVDQLARAGGG
jgi:hypothetical protein